MNVKAANMVRFVWGWEQYRFKPPPYLTISLMLDGSVDILDVIDTNSSRPQIVKPEAGFNEISTTVIVFNLQWHTKSPEPPLYIPHPPFCSLSVGKDRPRVGHHMLA